MVPFAEIILYQALPVDHIEHSMLDEVNCPVVLDGPVLIRDRAEAECDAINVRDATSRIYPFWWNSVLHERTQKGMG